MKTLSGHASTVGSTILVVSSAIIGGAIYIFLKVSSAFGQAMFWLGDKISRPMLKEEVALSGKTLPERRIQARNTVNLPCVITGLLNGKQTHEKAQVMGFSRQGMYVEAKAPLDEGTEMNAEIKDRRINSTFLVMGKVIRRTAKGMAIRFADPVPSEVDMILTARRN